MTKYEAFLYDFVQATNSYAQAIINLRASLTPEHLSSASTSGSAAGHAIAVCRFLLERALEVTPNAAVVLAVPPLPEGMVLPKVVPMLDPSSGA